MTEPRRTYTDAEVIPDPTEPMHGTGPNGQLVTLLLTRPADSPLAFPTDLDAADAWAGWDRQWIDMPKDGV